MRARNVAALLVLAGLSGSPPAIAQSVREPGKLASERAGEVLWRRGDERVELTGCMQDNWPMSCLVVTRKGVTIARESADHAAVLWRPDGGTGPQVVVNFMDDGTAATGAIVSVDFTQARPVVVMRSSQIDDIAVNRVDGVLVLSRPIEILQYYGSHADRRYVMAPMVWRQGRFHWDVQKLSKGRFDKADMQERVAVTKAEVARNGGAFERPYPELSLALLPLILSGRSEDARWVLTQAWPATPAREKVWAELCHSIAEQEEWAGLKADGLSNAELVDRGAKQWVDPDA